MMRRHVLLLACLIVAMAPARPHAGEPLLADLSKNLIQITTGFTGTEVLLFGTVEEAGDVVVVVRGPDQTVPVWRKDRYGGIWINDTKVVFRRVPSFYAVGSNRPLLEVAEESVLKRRQIGVANLRLEAVDLDPDGAEYFLFRQALIRNKQLQGLFAIDVDKVDFRGGRLFRTRLNFPANVPTGDYQVEVILLRDGQEVSAQQHFLFVSKAGLGAAVFSFAHRQPSLYGILAVVAALLAGLSAAYMFRKG